ncbi:MAG: HAD family hydrolase [Clostridiales bacterium]|nr:HAD family hydrolase [Clostridiales bacterium]
MKKLRKMTTRKNEKLKYKCVLYDFDGTLADSVPVILLNQQMAYEEVMGHCPRTVEDLRSYIGLPLVDTFAMHDKETADKLLESYLRINLELLHKDMIPFFDGVEEELHELKKMGVMQGIMSAKRRTSLDITLDLKGYSDFFDLLVTKEDTEKHKPDPEPYLYCAEKLGIKPSEMIYVGDAIGDILGAKNAGVDSVFVEWSSMPKKEILDLKPTYVIKEMKELSCIIHGSEL